MSEFKEFEALEPFGAWRDNWHSAVVANILANVYRDPKRGQRPTVADFMYKDPDTRAEESIAAADQFFFAGKVGKNNGGPG